MEVFGKKLCSLILLLVFVIILAMAAEETERYKKVEQIKAVEGKDKPQKIKGELLFDSENKMLRFLDERKEPLDINMLI
ncbi:MAG: hypothetical protein A2Y62_18045 [Candidatus Fischerbacteria bacterium RBG_13_37_8]|uniref:Uncharacterized protein n=1 Tax=Candidatus Fischerbacteria bacterium RBG_13_37_8 TaxID=1817863 RepID=A0A1F5VVU4_9BACT|nr:MAG: hypothetical protein A2Y62_18045 [Candidatus Fischerbacteria bacterium RBG_13_37_8]